MKNGDKIGNYTSKQQAGLEALVYKGLLVSDDEVKGFRNTQGKLLFTMDPETWEITVANGVTAQDTITYELTSAERFATVEEFGVKISKVILNFVPNAPATYTVTFDANGGSGSMAAVTDVSGEYTLPACTFTAPAGKSFKCWSVGGVEKAVGATITVTAGTTVTAVWKDIPHVHVYDQKVATDAYKVSDATCEALATYYKSCTCGEAGSETFESGVAADHSWDDATCTEPKTCSVCGATEGEPNDHAMSRYYTGDENGHWLECEHCDYTTEVEPHVDEDDDQVCDVCNDELPEQPEEPESPKTGDNRMMLLWVMLLASGVALAATAVLGKKRFVR